MRLSLHRLNLNEYNVRVLPQELQKMKNSRLILLIVPQHSRGIAIMALAAHLIGLRAKLVLCVQTLPEDSIVSGEQVRLIRFIIKINILPMLNIIIHHQRTWTRIKLLKYVLKIVTSPIILQSKSCVDLRYSL